MFVCICKSKREKDILQSIDKGASTVAQITEDCQAGGDCGACRVKIDEILQELNTAHSNDSDQGS